MSNTLLSYFKGSKNDIKKSSKSGIVAVENHCVTDSKDSKTKKENVLESVEDDRSYPCISFDQLVNESSKDGVIQSDGKNTASVTDVTSTQRRKQSTLKFSDDTGTLRLGKIKPADCEKEEEHVVDSSESVVNKHLPKQNNRKRTKTKAKRKSKNDTCRGSEDKGKSQSDEIKTKTNSDDDSDIEVFPRRSLRKRSQIKRYVDESSHDAPPSSSSEDSLSSPKKKTRNKHKSPSPRRKQSQNKNAKLAPIFLLGKNALPKSPEKPPEDPWIVAARKAFLYSGLPEQVKRLAEQVVIEEEEAALPDHAPWPEINHVRQDVLQVVMESVMKVDGEEYEDDNLVEGDCQMAWRSGVLSTLDEFKTDLDLPIIDIKICKIHDDQSEMLISQYDETHPGFPWSKMYEACKWRRDMANVLQQQHTGDNDGDNGKQSEKRSANKKKKNEKRRRLRIDSDDEDEEVMIVEERISPKKEDKNVDDEVEEWNKPQLWSDKYKPQTSSDVLGNASGVKRLKQWLTDWKHRTDRQTNVLQQQMNRVMKKNKIKHRQAEENADDSSSDFEWSACDIPGDNMSNFIVNDDDDEGSDGEDALCNTIMLSGPNGIGKTAAVYAVAQELGYKVFEMNSSHRRNGRYLTAQLRESTQSHQVNKQRILDEINQGLLECVDSKNKEGKKDKLSKKEKRAIAKEKAEKVIDLYEKHLKDSAASLILFEEADIVFEDDDGYWQTVNTFMSTTKRPIILTTNDSYLSSSGLVRERFEEITFKQPSLMQMFGYLTCISLCEGVRLCPEDLLRLAHDNSCDLRKCIHYLHFTQYNMSDSKKQGDAACYEYRRKNIKYVISDDDEEMAMCQKLLPNMFNESTVDSHNFYKSSSFPGKIYEFEGEYVKSGEDNFIAFPTVKVKKRILDYSFDGSDDENEKISNTDITAFIQDGVGEVLSKLLLQIEAARAPVRKALRNLHNTLAYHYDNFSALDVLSTERNQEIYSKYLHPSCDNSMQRDDDDYKINFDYNLWTSLDECVVGCSDTLCSEKWNSSLLSSCCGESCIVPVKKCKNIISPCLSHPSNVHWLTRHIDNISHSNNVKKCYQAVRNQLPLGLSSHTSAVYTDYIPTLTNMCKAESFRQNCRTKRRGRFLHYLDSISLHLKSSCTDQLCSHFI